MSFIHTFRRMKSWLLLPCLGVAASCLLGCAAQTHYIAEPQPVASEPVKYTLQDRNEVFVAFQKYVKNNEDALAGYKPVLDSGVTLEAGTLRGQSYHPTTELLRQFGYLSFEAPDINVWMEKPPAGCIKGMCTFVLRIDFGRASLNKSVNY